MRLRRSDFAFPAILIRRQWRHLRWACFLLTGEHPSLYTPQTMLWDHDMTRAQRMVQGAWRLANPRGRWALVRRLQRGRQLVGLAVTPLSEEEQCSGSFLLRGTYE